MCYLIYTLRNVHCSPHSKHITQYTHHSIHTPLNTHTTQYTHHSIHTPLNTHTTQYTHHSIHTPHNTRTTQYTHHSIHTPHNTRTTQYTHHSIHAPLNTHTTLMQIMVPPHMVCLEKGYLRLCCPRSLPWTMTSYSPRTNWTRLIRTRRGILLISR